MSEPGQTGRLWLPPGTDRQALGYEAATDSARRKKSAGRLLHEDEQLTTSGRAKLNDNARDAMRNFALAGWIVRKHLDFVASHSFQAKTPDRGFNKELEAWVAEVSKPANFDHARRHGRFRFTRMAEARRVVDGDMGLLKIRSGHVQAIEGDRVRNPGFRDVAPGQLPEWRHGVRSKASGEAVAYAIHRRTGSGGFAYERTVAARRMFFYACYEANHRFDATRGVSPLVAGLDQLRDVRENFNYALAKMKVAQLFGLKLTRNGEDAAGNLTSTETTDGATTRTEHVIDFGKGPVVLDLDPGEDADFLENKTPAAEFQSFLQACVAVAMKALDLPFSFFDESFTNFFGSRAALLLYLQSAKHKRLDVQELLNAWFSWRFRLAFGRREIVPPRSLVDGFDYAFVPDGLPWWRPSEEIKADVQAIAAGVKTRGDVTLAHFGRTHADTLDILEAEENDIRRRRINVSEAPAAETAAAGGSAQPPAIDAGEMAAAIAEHLAALQQ